MEINPRELIQRDIKEEYRINVEELARSAGLEVRKGRLIIEDVAEMGPDALLELMSNLVSVIEYVVAMRVLMLSIAKQKTQDYEALAAQQRLQYQKQKNFARGSKSEADTVVATLPNLVQLKKKIISYEEYARYLAHLADIFEMHHYTAKAALNDSRRDRIMST